MRRLFALTVALLLAVTGVSACAEIPRSGFVNEGVAAGMSGNEDVQFLPAGPAQDASPEDIVRGFVDAATSPADDWGIARTFLSASFRSQWQPSHHVVIDRGNRIVSSVGDDTYQLTVSELANVDEWGLYAPIVEHSTTLGFSLVQERGQWRIALAPQGIILDAGLFPQVFSESQLYFYDSNFQRLVPDNRWFPARSSTSTRVVKALLQGPARWLGLSGGVVSAFPAGALLVADSVPLEGDTAVVNFDVKSLAANDVTLQRMLTQLGASLSLVPKVSRVRMLLSGARQLEASVPSSDSLLGGSYLTNPTVLTGQTFGALGAPASQSRSALAQKVVELRPATLSMSGTSNEVAFLNAGRASLIQTNGVVRTLDKRAGLVAPVIDGYGYVWSVPERAPTDARIFPSTSTDPRIAVPWTRATQLAGIAISPEGTRVAVSYRAGDKSEMCVAAIRRNSANAPEEIGPCLLIPVAGKHVGPVAWIDASRVGVVTYSSTNSTISTVRLGGMSVSSQVNAHVTTMTGAGSALVARVLTAGGDVLQQVSSLRWYLVATGVDALANVQ